MTDDKNTEDKNEPRVERRSNKGDRRAPDSDRRGNDRVVSELKPRRQKGDRRKP